MVRRKEERKGKVEEEEEKKEREEGASPRKRGCGNANRKVPSTGQINWRGNGDTLRRGTNRAAFLFDSLLIGDSEDEFSNQTVWYECVPY